MTAPIPILARDARCPPFRERLQAAGVAVPQVTLQGLRVAEPCAGSLASVRDALAVSGTSFTPVNVYDVQNGLCQMARMLYGEAAQTFNLGRSGGNLLDVPLDMLSDAHGLISGPPCPPWSSSGKRKGQSDARAAVFDRVVDWVIELGMRGTLVFFILENVPGILSPIEPGSNVRYVDTVFDILRAALPPFGLGVARFNMSSVLPINRERVFLYGLRRDCYTAELPRPLDLTGLQPVPGLSLLDMDLPCVLPGQLKHPSENNNLKLYEAFVKEEMAKRSEPACFVCFHVGRSFNRVWKASLYFDEFPCLTCNNRALFLMSLWDIDEPPHERLLHRYLSNQERFRLQGLPPELVGTLERKTAEVVAGNAFPHQLVAAVSIPLLQSISESGINIHEKCPSQLPDGSRSVRPCQR